MPKHFLSFILLLLFASAKVFAQDDENWVFKSPYAGKYYESPYEIRWGFFEHSESGRFDIKSLADAQFILKKNLQTKVVAVQLANIPSTELQGVYAALGQFPNLVYVKLLGSGGLNQDKKVNLLVANINKLPQLKCIEFAHIDSINMDAALKKLISLKQLRALSFTEYNRELPPSITLLDQIDSIKLSTINIGSNTLSHVNWGKLSVTGNPKSWSDQTGDLAKEESKILSKLSNIKSLKRIGLDVDLRYPDFISKFDQIDELNIGGVIEGRPSSPFMQAVGVLSQLKKLSIDLTGDKLTADIGPLKGLMQLHRFYLKMNLNQATGIGVLSNFKNLEILEMAQCKIGIMPDVFKDMRYLKTVALVNDEITKIPASLLNLPSLENLNLSYNRLTILPDMAFYGCNRLKHLNLMMNQLTSLPRAFGAMLDLETINCSNNKIETIPDDWAYLTHLKEVNFAVNRLAQFPEGLQNNHSVERITLFFNNIETFPDIETGDYKLNYLGITGNRKMFALPDHIGNYTEMDTLEAQYLHLKTMPESLGNCKKLKMLLLSGSITAKCILPAGLKNARDLEVLYLDGNPLLDHQSIFDVVLSQPRKLFHLNLASNNINKLPDTEKWMTTPFVSMNLRDNPITELPKELLNSKVKGSIDTKGTNIYP